MTSLDASICMNTLARQWPSCSGIITVPWVRVRQNDAVSSVTTSQQDVAAAMSEDQQTDEALFGAYRGGDRAAFTMLVERYSGELVQFLTKQIGSRAAAEDVFQETFLQVHNSAASFDLDRRFKPWLYTIAVNKGRDWHRRNARRKALSLSVNIGPDGEGQSFGDLLASDEPSPDAGLEAGERRESVKAVIDGMPEHYREILLLSYFQKMSYIQIAETLEIPLGTVKSRLHAAVASFGRGWEQDGSSGDRGEE